MEFKIPKSLFLAKLIPAYVIFAIFPMESPISMVHTIFPISIIVIFDIKLGKLNSASTVRDQSPVINVALVQSAIFIKYFANFRLKIDKLNSVNIAIPPQN